jgi:hypothetical protein
VALLLAPEQPYQIPAKFYEYLAIGTPMLVVTGPGATADAVAASRCGMSFSPSDVAGMADRIHRLMLGEGPPGAPKDVLERFDPRHLTSRLAEQLDRITGRPRAEQEAGPC